MVLQQCNGALIIRVLDVACGFKPKLAPKPEVTRDFLEKRGLGCYELLQAS